MIAFHYKNLYQARKITYEKADFLKFGVVD